MRRSIIFQIATISLLACSAVRADLALSIEEEKTTDDTGVAVLHVSITNSSTKPLVVPLVNKCHGVYLELSARDIEGNRLESYRHECKHIFSESDYLEMLPGSVYIFAVNVSEEFGLTAGEYTISGRYEFLEGYSDIANIWTGTIASNELRIEIE